MWSYRLAVVSGVVWRLGWCGRIVSNVWQLTQCGSELGCEGMLGSSVSDVGTWCGGLGYRRLCLEAVSVWCVDLA